MKKFKELFVTPVVFVNQAKEEFNKVVWPTREEVTSFTIVVIISVILISLFLWFIDTSLVTFIKLVIS